MIHSRCWMIFRIFKHEGKLDIEVLENSADYGFVCGSKPRSQYASSLYDLYNEIWSESCYKSEIARDIAKEIDSKNPLSETDDIYVEYIANYELRFFTSYEGESDYDETVENEKWQIIPQSEYDLVFGEDNEEPTMLELTKGT